MGRRVGGVPGDAAAGRSPALQVGSARQWGRRRGVGRRRGEGGAVTRVYVSLSGVDGAGKSTLIEALRTDLAEDHTVEVLWNPLLFWGQGLLNKLPERWRSQLGQGRPVKSERKDEPARPRPGAK